MLCEGDTLWILGLHRVGLSRRRKWVRGGPCLEWRLVESLIIGYLIAVTMISFIYGIVIHASITGICRTSFYISEGLGCSRGEPAFMFHKPSAEVVGNSASQTVTQSFQI